MDFKSLQFFEYALYKLVEHSKIQFELIVEYDKKLLTGNFLSNHEISLKYNKSFQRLQYKSDNINPTSSEIRSLLGKNFLINGLLITPTEIDLINAINHVVSLVSDDAEPLDTFNTATNVTFLETNLKFDFYRFPDNATFNVVSLKKLDN